jgi:DNA polymerase-1
MDDAIAQAQEQGYAVTLFGRRRALPEINSQNAQMRGFAERNAINTPLQGTAADIIKKAMIEVQGHLKDKKSKMILQVHDELVLEAPADRAGDAAALVRQEMERAYPLRVPLKVDVAIGPNWAELQ